MRRVLSIAMAVTLMATGLMLTVAQSDARQEDASGKRVKSSRVDVRVGQNPAGDGVRVLPTGVPPGKSVPIIVPPRSAPTAERAMANVSPGIVVGADTWQDYQANDDGQRAIASFGGPGNLVHFIYTEMPEEPLAPSDSNRRIRYNYYDVSAGELWTQSGTSISGLPGNLWYGRAGYASLDVNSAGSAVGAFHQRNGDNVDPIGPSSTVVGDSDPDNPSTFAKTELSQSVTAEAIWPHVAVDRGGSLTKSLPGDDVYHVVSRASGSQTPYVNREIFYWRRVGDPGDIPEPAWEGPVILTADVFYDDLNHHVAVDPTSAKVAVVYQYLSATPLLQVHYLESSDNGADWLQAPYPQSYTDWSGTPPIAVTSYTDPGGSQAWQECSGEYDLEGRFHVIWVEQVVAEASQDCRIVHWDDLTLAKHTIAEAIGWTNLGGDGQRDLWLASPQMAFGTGSTPCSNDWQQSTNYNYMYLTYEQYGGSTSGEQFDVSLGGYQNLEIYLTASVDHGETWGQPINLTNTKTPNCAAGNCDSERDPSIAKIVDDAINIFYILDQDAGDVVFGQGSWTSNLPMYHRIPSVADDPHFCPGRACDCPFQADLDASGFIDALDLSALIDAVFFGGPESTDPDCPTSRGDFNADGNTDIVDLAALIDRVFSGGSDPVDACTCFPCDTPASGSGSVTVESKTVSTNQVFTVGVELRNDEPLRAFTVPLSIRSVGAYPSAISGRYVPGARLDGLLEGVSVINEHTSENGNCKEGQPGGFGTIGPVGADDPDALLFSRNIIIVGELPAGDDGDTPSIEIDFNAGPTAGTFEIDTTCTDPSNHLVFVDAAGLGFIPLFTPGVITVEGSGCDCPFQCDYDQDAFLTAIDLGSLIDMLFAGDPEITDPLCPTSRGDFNNDGFPTAIDLGQLIDYLFAGGAGPCNPCDPIQSSCSK